MVWLGRALYRLMQEEEGQGLVEYGLLIALISIACVGALLALSAGIKEALYDKIVTELINGVFGGG